MHNVMSFETKKKIRKEDIPSMMKNLACLLSFF